MKRSHRLASLLILGLLLFGRTAFGIPVDAVANPHERDFSFVEDEAGVLGPGYASLIDGISRELEAKSSIEMAVVTVGDLDGATVEDFAQRLFARFGIGKRGKDNGLLILFSRDDRRVRIEVGYGLEGALNDAKAGRLLDEHAIGRFKAGEYGRGLYETAKAAAELLAAAQGVKLSIADPAAWPEQVAIEEPAAEAPSEEPAIPVAFVLQAVLFALLLGGIPALFLLVKALRVGLRRAKAAKKQALGSAHTITVLTWMLGGFATFFWAAASERIIWPLIAYFGIGAAVTLFQRALEPVLRRRVAEYRLVCPGCGRPMDLVSESADDRYLKPEEVAEERAGGMDYEFWHCEPCDRLERLEVKLRGAARCDRCGRRTLQSESETLQAATESHAGRMRITHTCRNPRCGYHWVEERRIPKVSSSSSGSSSFGSSGGSSFGGGSSGGGGASRGF